jgi:hypothetical protein
MKRDEAPIQQPCSEDWNAMTGDDRKRFCGQCNKHVHDLSAMSESEARSVVARKNVCVCYSVDPATRSIRHRPSRRFVLRAATAALTAGLALPAAAAISREPGEVGLIQQAWERLTDWTAGDSGVVMGELPMEPLPAEPPTRVMMGEVEEAAPPPVMGRMVRPPTAPDAED